MAIGLVEYRRGVDRIIGIHLPKPKETFGVKPPEEPPGAEPRELNVYIHDLDVKRIQDTPERKRVVEPDALVESLGEMVSRLPEKGNTIILVDRELGPSIQERMPRLMEVTKASKVGVFDQDKQEVEPIEE